MYERKNDDICIVWRGPGRSFCWQVMPLLPLKDPRMSAASRNTGQRAVLKFAAATPIAGRLTPGTFTNQIQAAFLEPRFPVFTVPRAEHQPLTEASYVSLPAVALCHTHALHCVRIATPCRNKGAHSRVWCGRCWPGRSCICVAPCPMNTRGRACLIATSTEIKERLKRGGFSGWVDMAPAPKITAAQSEVSYCPEGSDALSACPAVHCRRLEYSAAAAQATDG